jgi:DNA-binding beta-propeller fold protein YncE
VEFTTKNDYGFARVSFQGVEIDKTTNQYYFDDGDFSHDTPDINADNGQVINTRTSLYLYVYYEGKEVAKLQVYHDFAILEEVDYKPGR